MKRIISLILISSVLALSGCTVIKTVKEGIRSGKESTAATETTAESSMVASVSETPAETTSEASSATTTEKAKHSFKYEYGVFLSFEGKLEKLSDYYTIVIDAQYYDKAEIEAFKAKGHKVLSYINIGSLEDFRSYFKRFEDLELGAYENWQEEIWIDVSNASWQQFIIGELMPELAGKGIDGFFVDNCDVYYNYPRANILSGLTNMMKALKQTGLAVLINGGDTYLDAYCKSGGSWNDVITGINQENVFAKIIWDKNKFGKADPEDHKYFMSYVERYAEKGADIYLLEYTKDKNLIAEIDEYCKAKGFNYYVSDSVELD